MQLIDFPQGSEEWLSYRKNRIGASDIAAIMGISPWMTKLELWNEKQGIHEVKETYAMTRGKELEAYSRKLLEMELDREFQPLTFQSDKFPWACASLDGYDGQTFVEIKCPMNYQGYDEIPPHYYAQIQWQFMVMEFCDEALFVVFDGENNHVTPVYRDEDYIFKCVSEAEKFYKSLLDFTPPDPSPKDWVINESEEWATLSEKYKALDEIVKEAEKKKESIKRKLIDISKGKCMRGKGISVSNYVRKGNVQYSKIPELKGVDLDQYRANPIHSSRITLTKESV